MKMRNDLASDHEKKIFKEHEYEEAQKQIDHWQLRVEQKHREVDFLKKKTNDEMKANSVLLR